jgi:predicted DNA-binding transcriptional regulator AlpA
MELREARGMSDAREIESASPEELVAIIAEAEATKARAYARLMGPREVTAKAPDRTINAREAAEILGVGKDWVYSHAEEIPGSWRKGKVLRFSAAAVEAWKASGRA